MTKHPPSPRPSGYPGFSAPTYQGDTWIEAESDRLRCARVRFPDGKLRVVRCGGVPDTYFSIACSSHDGYLTTQETPWAPGDTEYVFQPHTKSQARYGEWPADH
jgi:hypothetical protein